MTGPSVRVFDGITGEVSVGTVAELRALLAKPRCWVWVDVPAPDQETALLLTDTFGVHPKAAADGLTRNHIARLHHYGDVLYLALHRPEPGAAGHVHYLELDFYVGPRLVNEFAQQVGFLEQRVMSQADDDHPQEFLDELFTVRHTLLTVRTMAAQGAEVLARTVQLMDRDVRAVGEDEALADRAADRHAVEDLRDQYERLAQITRSQLEFLEGVTDFYRARTDTRMTIAAERLAVIAAVTLPVAAVSGVIGMNVIVNDRTQWTTLLVLVTMMAALSTSLLVWAKRQGWW